MTGRRSLFIFLPAARRLAAHLRAPPCRPWQTAIRQAGSPGSSRLRRVLARSIHAGLTVAIPPARSAPSSAPARRAGTPATSAAASASEYLGRPPMPVPSANMPNTASAMRAPSGAIEAASRRYSSIARLGSAPPPPALKGSNRPLRAALRRQYETPSATTSAGMSDLRPLHSKADAMRPCPAPSRSAVACRTHPAAAALASSIRRRLRRAPAASISYDTAE